MLSYPTSPQPHGRYFVLPEDFAQMQHANKVLISDVFYDATRNQASVDLYARVITNNFHILGFVRASLGLHHIWVIVDNETSESGPGSYAFILDGNGVRVAYTNPDPSGLTHPASLFKAVAPLSASFIQRVRNENLYGYSTTPIMTLADSALAASQNAARWPDNRAPHYTTYPALRYLSPRQQSVAKNIL